MSVLTIKFKFGGTYDYIDVEEELFNEMKEAPSVGKFFHARIKGKYDFLNKSNKERKKNKK